MKKLNTRKQTKKSTMLLVSIVITLLTLYCAYIIIVNQRFASNNLSYANNDKSQYRKVRFNPSEVVVVSGLQDGIILMSDSISVEVFNADVAAFRSAMVNDTLRLIFNKATTSKAYLYLPSGTRIVLDSSALEMRGSLDYRSLPEYDLRLRSSSLLASGHETHSFVGKLAITASGNSRVNVARYFHINELDLHNVHEATLAQGWQIGNLKTSYEDGMNVVMDKYRDSVAIRPLR